MLNTSTVIIAFALLIGFTQVNQAAYADQVTYKFGVVPQYEANELATIWLPILQELEKRTGFKFKLTGSPRIPDFEKNFMQGDFDFAYMNPYHSLLAAKSQQYTPLVRDGKRRLFGILVVRKGSGITSPEQLEGKIIAFPAPNALGASLIMRADLDQLFHISFQSSYVQTHSSVYLNVALGKMAAGGGVMSTLSQQPQEIQDRLEVLYQTRQTAPHPIMAHPRVPAAHQEQVKKALLDMGKDKNNLALLAEIPILGIIEAAVEDYEELNQWGLEKYLKSDED